MARDENRNGIECGKGYGVGDQKRYLDVNSRLKAKGSSCRVYIEMFHLPMRP